MIPNVKRGVSAVRARNSTLPTRWPPPGGMTIARWSIRPACSHTLRTMLGRLVPVLCVGLAGCGFYTGTEKATQVDVIGSTLHFTVTFCATNATPGSGDATTADGTISEPGDPCGTTSSGGAPTTGQGLIALRFPA